jgi:hypothetical protein
MAGWHLWDGLDSVAADVGLVQEAQPVSDQGNLSSAIIENRHGVGVLVGGW